jgi:hypothetical protein
MKSERPLRGGRAGGKVGLGCVGVNATGCRLVGTGDR